MRILVVDDDSRIRQMTADALRDNGHDVEEADCGATALALLDESISVLLTDVQMPNMTGPELADAARMRFPQLAVRFMSGDTGSIPREAFQGQAVLAKPFTISALLAAVGGSSNS
ncbi:MAG: response regulator [Sphingomonadales bacterium]|nr:response regulator [Sphingomonadales bacterium]